MTKNRILYEDLKFPHLPSRPFFYSDFVTTIDGKVYVQKKGYWPIGSRFDYTVFTFLRAHADIIVDGKNTAVQFGKKTIETIHSKEFLKIRKSLGKTKPVQYGVVTHHIDEKLMDVLRNEFGFKPCIFTTPNISFDKQFKKKANIIPVIADTTTRHLSQTLFVHGFKTVFIDGGPTLLRQFLENNLLDELFVTLAPKIFGTGSKTLTMVEGGLFPPDKIKQFRLVFAQPVKDEVYLRYQMKST